MPAMGERAERAGMSHAEKKYNCSQAVFCAFSDLFGMDEKTAFQLAEGFGGGMGGMQDTCGAVTAMFMVAGLLNSKGNLENARETRPQTYALVKELAQKFREKMVLLIVLN